MEPCCHAGEYAGIFGGRSADRQANRFLRRGLTGTAATLAAGVRDVGIDDTTVLEVGGGMGGLHADLLRAGASRAVNVELSPGWEQAAERVLAELALTARVQRRIGDFVALADELPMVDVVVLHRVVCCYPDWQALLGLAADHAGRTIGFTVPRDGWSTRAAISIGNGFLRLSGRRFRAFVHPVDAMVESLVQRGFAMQSDSSGLVWRTLVLQRPVT